MFKDIGANFDYLSKRFYQVPQSRWGGPPLKEEPSDMENVGLRKFRDSVQTNTGLDSVFYECVENGRVKYFIYCDDGSYPAHRQFCHLSFPWGNGLFVDDLKFTRNYLPHSIRMADQIAAKLKEFEIAGRASMPATVTK